MQAQSETTTVDATEPATALESHFGNEQPIVTVPYATLRPSPLNARTKPLSGIPGLAANIRAKGLLQNLVVHEMKGSCGRQRKYGVCAGQRREAALDLLFEQKDIACDYPVPVRIVSEGEALAISLIENTEREGLDPYDVLRAYRMLAEEGRSVDYIAALFSASPLTVKRRMKLANVSPKLLALLREDEITLDQLAALALADNHETQEHIWFDANEWQRQPNYLRQAITRTEIDASRSRLVRFIGLDTYEAAGGYVRRDLFSDDGNAGYIADAELLQRLVARKLDVAAEEVRAEGWGWTETRVERDVLELNRHGKLRPVQRAYTDDEQHEMDALTAEQDDLAGKLETLSEDDENAYEEADRLDAEIGRVNAAIVALESCALVWDTQQMAEAGAFVIIDPQGKLLIERGLVRRENSAALDAAGATVIGTPQAEAADAADGPVPKIKPVHSAKLCQRLTAHRTVAIHAEMVAQPAVALAALLRHLVPQALPEHYGYTSARDYLALSGGNNHDSLLRAADDLPTSAAWNAIEAQRARWVAELPAKRADLLPWLAKQDPGTTLLDLLAFCAGTLLDGIAGEEKPQAINALAYTLNLDMTRYWTPTRATYFDHVSKARIGEVVSAAVSPKVAADLGKMKKADAAAAAELRLAKVAWLPEILTDMEIPVTPSWDAHDDDDGDAGEDKHDPDSCNGSDGAQDDDGASDPRSDHSGINNTVRDVAVSPASADT
ncbi:chromosome partitioning protein ParB [Burkholderia cepacia]|uniref:ParB/RepB/Spo0J family partition protein n=1 Tax=Burkholderia cepacia TaxID=292 RepID=UPI00075631EF|nr:ParB/Srx family N-terminal domain-containing protein [Burkholderia cepacia]KVA54847.1 chromosome partitioning protein ParB [Burkholderia cepacia]KVA55923.1 chromosome partitioning protein ParB [Burkholderia cepacia]KVA79221.1 chromosome partitioning protein ParB [Burkholderia cepacia]KVA83207.1 chromosome partitioning protein ParB [Burkholderia cepacia]KVA91618.1 chromosome partitioning protein ParB [Burkholderia cepacia]